MAESASCRWKILSTLMVIALTGCGAHHPESFDSGYDTSAGLPSDYRVRLARGIRRSVVDPQSIIDTGIAPPKKDTVGLVWGEWTWVCTRMNGRNRFGGMAGPQIAAFGFQGSRVRMIENPDQVCSDVRYGPFPELDEAIRQPISYD